ncbi:hypothetical protein SRB5_66990 [Streptomyces sp. RB5]|uniref:Uncharacterized protein n=1 Tax=Streptomyces smaragdinus TaxID=2585196 RepID=A0A7K0CSS1_9ACTN|nr:hypothetical protein [Streptomyces smaragdinus]
MTSGRYESRRSRRRSASRRRARRAVYARCAGTRSVRNAVVRARNSSRRRVRLPPSTRGWVPSSPVTVVVSSASLSWRGRASPVSSRATASGRNAGSAEAEAESAQPPSQAPASWCRAARSGPRDASSPSYSPTASPRAPRKPSVSRRAGALTANRGVPAASSSTRYAPHPASGASSPAPRRNSAARDDSSAASSATAPSAPNTDRARTRDRARAAHAPRAPGSVPYAHHSCAAARAPGVKHRVPAPARSRSRAPRIAAASRSCTPRSYPSSYAASATVRTAASGSPPAGPASSTRAARYSARYTAGDSDTSGCSQNSRAAANPASRTGIR